VYRNELVPLNGKGGRQFLRTNVYSPLRETPKLPFRTGQIATYNFTTPGAEDECLSAPRSRATTALCGVRSEI
jgi:hypothetical protein